MDPRAGDALEPAEEEATNDELEATRHQIEETRAQLGDTINAIQEKLSPQHLIEQAKETVHEATIGKAQQVMSNAVDAARGAVSSAVDTTRDAVGGVADSARATGYSLWDTVERNPMPAAMVALGLGWLFMSTRRDRERDHWRYTTRRDEWYHATTREHPGYRPAGIAGETSEMTHMPAGATRPGHGELGEQREGMVDRAREAVGGAMETAGDAMSRAGYRARDVGGSVWDRIEANPLPAAACAISLGWLLMGNRQGESRRDDASDDRANYGRGYAAGGSATGGDCAGTRVEDRGAMAGTGQRTGDTGPTVQERAGDVVDSVRERAGDVADTVRQTTGEVVDRVQDRYERVATGARYQADRVADEFQRLVRDNPLAAGAAVFAIGAAIGMAVPSTRRERELMGETRDRLVDRAQDAMQDVAGRVRSVAGEAVDSVKDAASREGLMPETGGSIGSMGVSGGIGSPAGSSVGGTIGQESVSTSTATASGGSPLGGTDLGRTLDNDETSLDATLADDSEDDTAGTSTSGSSVVPGYDRSRRKG